MSIPPWGFFGAPAGYSFSLPYPTDGRENRMGKEGRENRIEAQDHPDKPTEAPVGSLWYNMVTE